MTLRITRDDGASPRTKLKLEGRLVGEWAALLDRECSALLRSSVSLELDLSGVSFVDRAGIDVLARLSLVGVEIRDCTDAVGSVLQGEGVPITHS